MITKTKQRATVLVALSLPGMIRCNHKIKCSWRTFGTAAKKNLSILERESFSRLILFVMLTEGTMLLICNVVFM